MKWYQQPCSFDGRSKVQFLSKTRWLLASLIIKRKREWKWYCLLLFTHVSFIFIKYLKECPLLPSLLGYPLQSITFCNSKWFNNKIALYSGHLFKHPVLVPAYFIYKHIVRASNLSICMHVLNGSVSFSFWCFYWLAVYFCWV